MYYLTIEGEKMVKKKKQKLTAEEIADIKKDKAYKRELNFLRNMSHETKQHFFRIKGYNRIKLLLKRKQTQNMITNLFAKSILGIGDSDCKRKYALAKLSRDSGMYIEFPDRYSYKYFRIHHKEGTAVPKHPKEKKIHASDMIEFFDRIKEEFDSLLDTQFGRITLLTEPYKDYTIVHIAPEIVW